MGSPWGRYQNRIHHSGYIGGDGDGMESHSQRNSSESTGKFFFHINPSIVKQVFCRYIEFLKEPKEKAIYDTFYSILSTGDSAQFLNYPKLMIDISYKRQWLALIRGFQKFVRNLNFYGEHLVYQYNF